LQTALGGIGGGAVRKPPYKRSRIEPALGTAIIEKTFCRIINGLEETP
jgi:hypothetical protein